MTPVSLGITSFLKIITIFLPEDILKLQIFFHKQQLICLLPVLHAVTANGGLRYALPTH